MLAGVAQAVACSTSCTAPGRFHSNSLSPQLSGLLGRTSWCRHQRSDFSVRAVPAQEECNEEECAPQKEVGKLSMEWVAEEKTKVAGTFPPLSRQQMSRWTGYVEKDTAGQTNIYSIEPTVYVAESAISSGTAGGSSDGSGNTLAISAGLGLVLVAGAAVVLIQLGKNSPDRPQEIAYTGPTLSYYIQKFDSQIVEASSPAAPNLTTPVDAPVDSPAVQEALEFLSAVPTRPATEIQS